jgi:hypothetical protein
VAIIIVASWIAACRTVPGSIVAAVFPSSIGIFAFALTVVSAG